MRYRLKIAEEDFEQLQSLVFANAPKEAGAFALAGLSCHGHTTDIIVRRAIEIPAELFTHQGEYHLEVAPQALNGLAGLCEANRLGVVICHSHPDVIPYSSTDDIGESKICDFIRNFIPNDAPTASLLFYPGGVRGRVWVPSTRRAVPLSEILIMGNSIRRITFNKEINPTQVKNEEIYDRQVRAFGNEGQGILRNARVGIVGCGGTGSPTAEQLVRLGVSDLVLIDPDEFQATNVTRVYGTFRADIGKKGWWKPKRARKVDLIKKHLKKIDPAVKIRSIPENVILKDSIKYLRDRDVIFLCTDNHWSRSVINQFVYQFFIPAINLGTRIDAKNDVIIGAVGTVDILRPGLPCLWCSQFLNADRIAAESMPKNSRESRIREGYVQDVDTPAPAVISLNTTISGLAVTLFIQLMTGFMGGSGNIARLNYDILNSEVRRGRAPVPEKCLCKKVKAFGDLHDLPIFDQL